MIGHRGSGAVGVQGLGGLRENSVGSLTAAVRSGLEWVELDVHRCAADVLGAYAQILEHESRRQGTAGTLLKLVTDVVLAAGAVEWRSNRSEGDSFYFLDPDGHRLEAHVGGLASRLAACRAAPYAGMRFFDD